ncbi:hypothetical protein PVAP13_3KG123620 [Panicum virgatum]|uniref:Uncharacterized protein n=1 Tax=Panicum virgatum TaxID=38727 RepID=A0A8T0USE1_PANVG|nr:hypothetical protein PVAP13_3KG123620 [Panicum virgatum]
MLPLADSTTGLIILFSGQFQQEAQNGWMRCKHRTALSVYTTGLFGYGTKSSLATILSSASSSLALEIQGGVFGCMIQISLIYTSSCLVAWFTGVASPLPPCGE